MKANIRADSMKPPIYAEIEGHPESSEVKHEDTVYSNVTDYLTPVSSSGTDTMSTIGEHHTMRTLPEVMPALITHTRAQCMHQGCTVTVYVHQNVLDVIVVQIHCVAQTTYTFLYRCAFAFISHCFSRISSFKNIHDFVLHGIL